MMVVVTVESPRGRLTLAVPDDVPVEQLLPVLVAACRCEQMASRWSLRPRGASELDGERTLEESGVYRGAILELQVGEPLARPAQRSQPSWGEVGAYHARRVAGAAWRVGSNSLPERLGALGALGAGGWSRISRPSRPRSARELFPAPTPRNPAHRAVSTPARATESDRAIAAAILERGLLIAVLGRERGAGASTVAALLATLLARLRGDRVVAVDTDPLSASLSLSLSPSRRVRAAELLSAVAPGGTGSLNQHLVREQHGLFVLPAPILAGTGAAARLDQAAYTALLAQLTRSAELAVVDCGVADVPGGRAALASADLAVIVSRADELEGRRLGQIVQAARASCRSVVVLVNRSRRPRQARTARANLTGADHTVWLSDEPAAAARLRAAAFSWEAAPRSWHGEVRALAAALLIGERAT
jgi:cellulose biosynthesis protein BcsQ